MEANTFMMPIGGKSILRMPIGGRVFSGVLVKRLILLTLKLKKEAIELMKIGLLILTLMVKSISRNILIYSLILSL